MKTLSILLLLVLLAAACTPAPLPTPTATFPALPTLTSAVINPTAASTAQVISPELLRNFTYMLESSRGLQATLVDGSFTAKDAGGLFVVSGQLVKYALGDLNGDGVQDAAVTLAVNTGGSGTFHELIVVLAQDGKAVQAADLFLEDRLAEKSLSIAGGLITLEMIRHATHDPLCCPTENAVTVYRYEAGQLAVVSDQVLPSTDTKKPDFYPNEITIDSPQNGDFVGKNFLLRGKTSQMPFEKNLVVRIYYGSANRLLSEQPLAVQGEYGGPGSFETDLQLPADLKGSVHLDVVDIDMANGQPRGLASVALNIQQ